MEPGTRCSASSASSGTILVRLRALTGLHMTTVTARLQSTENFKNIQKHTLDLPAYILYLCLEAEKVILICEDVHETDLRNMS
jgi:hypothetical protein